MSGIEEKLNEILKGNYGGTYILNENSYEPIPCEDIIKWSEWFEENRTLRIVGRTPLAPGIYVSTVFLGMDHGVGDESILWESMVVGDDALNDEVGYVRYSTYKKAIEGHMKLVDEVRRKLSGSE